MTSPVASRAASCSTISRISRTRESALLCAMRTAKIVPSAPRKIASPFVRLNYHARAPDATAIFAGVAEHEQPMHAISERQVRHAKYSITPPAAVRIAAYTNPAAGETSSKEIQPRCLSRNHRAHSQLRARHIRSLESPSATIARRHFFQRVLNGDVKPGQAEQSNQRGQSRGRENKSHGHRCRNRYPTIRIPRRPTLSPKRPAGYEAAA